MRIHQEHISLTLTFVYICIFIFTIISRRKFRKENNSKEDKNKKFNSIYIVGLLIGLIHCFIGFILLFSSSRIEVLLSIFLSLYITFPAIFISKYNRIISSILLFIAAFLPYPLMIIENDANIIIGFFIVWTLPMIIYGSIFFIKSIKQ